MNLPPPRSVALKDLATVPLNEIIGKGGSLGKAEADR